VRFIASDRSHIPKGGESLGDEESCKEEKEVTPASILAPGARPLAPDVYLDSPASRAIPSSSLQRFKSAVSESIRRLGVRRPWKILERWKRENG
jgi:hypothetical protein